MQNSFNVIALDDLLSELSEQEVNNLLADFLCPLDPDIEEFLKSKSIDFNRQNKSKTFLVYNKDGGEGVLVGYFATCMTFIEIKEDLEISQTQIKKIFGPLTRQRAFPAFLIGQIGKNYNSNANALISGNDLLQLAYEKILLAQSIMAGRIILVECKDDEKLKNFYVNNGFLFYGYDENDKLCQYIKSTKNILR